MLASRRLPSFALLLGFAWLLAALQLAAGEWAATAVTLPDTDDAMRLVQLREFLAGRRWFDLHEPRLGPPTGYDTHWSRLIDVGLAGLFLAFRTVAAPEQAERLTAILWPMLWLLPIIGGVAALAWRLGGRDAALIALLLATFSLPAFQQFRPGRIDHHNVQMTLAVLTVAVSVWAGRWRAAPLATGLLSGLASNACLCDGAGASGQRILRVQGRWPIGERPVRRRRVWAERDASRSSHLTTKPFAPAWRLIRMRRSRSCRSGLRTNARSRSASAACGTG